MIVAVVQARMGSSRLPGKMLADLAGEPMLVRVVGRVARSTRVDRVCVATSDTPADDAIEKLCREREILCHRGALDDVLDRVVCAAREPARKSSSASCRRALKGSGSRR